MIAVLFFAIFALSPFCVANHPFASEEAYYYDEEPITTPPVRTHAMIDARMLYKNQKDVPEPNFIKANLNLRNFQINSFHTFSTFQIYMNGIEIYASMVGMPSYAQIAHEAIENIKYVFKHVSWTKCQLSKMFRRNDASVLKADYTHPLLFAFFLRRMF